MNRTAPQRGAMAQPTIGDWLPSEAATPCWRQIRISSSSSRALRSLLREATGGAAISQMLLPFRCDSMPRTGWCTLRTTIPRASMHRSILATRAIPIICQPFGTKTGAPCFARAKHLCSWGSLGAIWPRQAIKPGTPNWPAI